MGRFTSANLSLVDVKVTHNADTILHTDVIPCHVADHELIKKSKQPPVFVTTPYDSQSLYRQIVDKGSNPQEISQTDNVDISVNVFTEVTLDSIDTIT